MTPCLLCNSRDASLAFVKNGCRVLRCPSCRFAYADQSPSISELHKLYDEDYFHGDPSKFGYLDYAAEKANRTLGFEPMKRHILEKFPKGGRLLDVGCADGSFLDMFGDGWKTEGIELSASMISDMRPDLRSRVFQGFFEEFQSAEAVYDVITLWDVLDRLRDPLSALSKAHALLKPGGELGIVTGDMDSVFARLMGKHWYLYIPPVHLSYFSRTSIRESLRRAGFVDPQITYEGKPVSLGLFFYRGAHLFDWRPWRRFFEMLAARAPASLRFRINFRDVMTVWATKVASA